MRSKKSLTLIINFMLSEKYKAYKVYTKNKNNETWTYIKNNNDWTQEKHIYYHSSSLSMWWVRYILKQNNRLHKIILFLNIYCQIVSLRTQISDYLPLGTTIFWLPPITKIWDYFLLDTFIRFKLKYNILILPR